MYARCWWTLHKGRIEEIKCIFRKWFFFITTETCIPAFIKLHINVPVFIQNEVLNVQHCWLFFIKVYSVWLDFCGFKIELFMQSDNLILRVVVVSCRLRVTSPPGWATPYKTGRERSITSKLQAFNFHEEIGVQIIVTLRNFLCGSFGEWYLVNLTNLAVCQTSYQITALLSWKQTRFC